jgi:ABC-type amino acid transport substrate-binding protein
MQSDKTGDSSRIGKAVLSVGVDESPPPPLCFGLPGSPDFRGFEVDLMTAIASRLGVSLKWKSALWSTIFGELESGRLDLICTAATITPERRLHVDYSDPYLETELALIVRRESPIQLPADLAGRTVGVRVATVAEEFVRGHCRPGAVQTFNLNVDAYQALRDRRVDAVIDDRPIGVFFARTLEGLSVAPRLAGTELQYGMVFAKGNDELRQAVNRALAELRTDSTWERLYRLWFQEGDTVN